MISRKISTHLLKFSVLFQICEVFLLTKPYSGQLRLRLRNTPLDLNASSETARDHNWQNHSKRKFFKFPRPTTLRGEISIAYCHKKVDFHHNSKNPRLLSTSVNVYCHFSAITSNLAYLTFPLIEFSQLKVHCYSSRSYFLDKIFILLIKMMVFPLNWVIGEIIIEFLFMFLWWS